MSSTLNALCRSIIAGATAVTFCNPIWVVKTRIQLQTNVEPELASSIKRFRNYNSIGDAILRIYREEGLRSFFKGLSVSYLGLTETAIQFTCYDCFKRFVYKYNDHPSKFCLFCTAALAKLVATTTTYPHEVVRTRMRERTVGTEYSTLISSFKALYRESGMRGMYAGFTAHVLRTVPNAAIMFVIVEVLLHR